MSNPLYNALGGAPQAGLAQRFQAFVSQMQGQDPQAIINQLVASGRVSQAQLNQAQQQARQLSGLLSSVRLPNSQSSRPGF